MSTSNEKGDKIRFTDMDPKQKREYKKVKERERRNKMTLEQKEIKKNKARLGMEKYRDELSDEWIEYNKICDKHRKRKQRKNYDADKQSEVNFKSKMAMRTFRKNFPDTYIPRSSRNMLEDQDWSIFFEKGEKNKEILHEMQPDIETRIFEKKKSEKDMREQKAKDEINQCVCSYEFAYCLYCQNNSEDKSDSDEEYFDIPDLTKEQVEEFERESFENWIDARKLERRNKCI